MAMTTTELQDAIAKAIADVIGHGLREQCERHAAAVLQVIDAHLTRQPEVSEEFAAWLEREMPEGTVIGNPKWWADRIARQLPKHNRPAQEKAEPVASFQSGCEAWMDECFIPSLYSNMAERGDRLLEEVLELLQSTGYDRNRVATLVDYVYGRPVGNPEQEVGGVMVTLAGFCWIAGLNMHVAGDKELARITQPEVMAKIRAKQEAKNALHFDTPLPGHAQSAERARVPVASDADITEWAERHDLNFGGSKTDARSAFEDAQTLSAERVRVPARKFGTTATAYEMARNDGWNACIDFIEREAMLSAAPVDGSQGPEVDA